MLQRGGLGTAAAAEDAASMDIETHGSQKGSRVARTACRAAKYGCPRGLVGVEVLGAHIWMSSVEMPWRDHSLLQKLLLPQAECLGFSSSSFPSKSVSVETAAGAVFLTPALCLWVHSRWE